MGSSTRNTLWSLQISLSSKIVVEKISIAREKSKLLPLPEHRKETTPSMQGKSTLLGYDTVYLGE
jgi:hypothetical protein